MPAADYHFITVSRAGVLVARRKGYPPVEIATASEGISITPDAEAQARGVPPRVQVFFAHKGGNTQLYVTTLVTEEGSLPIREFQSRYSVSNEELGKWIRAAIDGAVDARKLTPTSDTRPRRRW